MHRYIQRYKDALIDTRTVSGALCTSMVTILLSCRHSFPGVRWLLCWICLFRYSGYYICPSRASVVLCVSRDEGGSLRNFRSTPLY